MDWRDDEEIAHEMPPVTVPFPFGFLVAYVAIAVFSFLVGLLVGYFW